MRHDVQVPFVDVGFCDSIQRGKWFVQQCDTIGPVSYTHLSAFLWATAYIAVKQLVAEVPPSVLLAFRFSFAAIILAVICIPKFKHYTKDLLFSGMKMGTAMFFEFFLFTVALQYTSASKSSFIIASYIIILPIVYLIIRRKKPTGSDVLASVICMVCLLYTSRCV